MAEPVLAVIIVAHNQGAYLAQTLTSLAEQTLGVTQMQVILIDDASTDDTLEQFESFQARYPDNVVIRQVQFRNVGQTRNAALDLVNAPYLMFLDGDDLLAVDACAALLQVMCTADVGMAISPLQRFRSSPPLQVDHQPSLALFSAAELMKKLLQHRDYMGHLAGICFRSSLFTGIRFPTFSAYEDVYLAPDLIQRAERIAMVHRSYYFYRMTAGSTSSSLNDEKAGCMLSVLEKLAGFAVAPALRRAYQALCVRQCRILLDNVRDLSAVHQAKIADLILQIPLWPFLLAMDIRVSRKRLLLQTRRQVRLFI